MKTSKLKQSTLLSAIVIMLSQLFACETLPPKDISEYISPLVDGNTWVMYIGRMPIPQVVNGDTIYTFRKAYTTNLIDGDTIINGKECKKFHLYFHFNPTVQEGDTVYTSDKCPHIFPGALYVCGNDKAYNKLQSDDNDIYNVLRGFFTYWSYNPSYMYEEDFTIREISHYKYMGKEETADWPIVNLNLSTGERFKDLWRVVGVSSITLSDGKERRMMEVKPQNSHHCLGSKTTYWIEGIGSVRYGISQPPATFMYKPAPYHLIRFSTNGQVIYTSEEVDYFNYDGIIVI